MGLTQVERDYGLEIIHIWRDLLKLNMRMATDALQFYQVGVQAVYGEHGGIDFAINAGASAMNGGAQPDPFTPKARFASADDIKAFGKAYIDSKLGVYEHKYY